MAFKLTLNDLLPFLFWSPSLPCPYLAGRYERRLVADISNGDPIEIHEQLSDIGFRRSHGVMYRPVCNNCCECIPVRVFLGDFILSRSQKRVLSKNNDLRAKIVPAIATQEQYLLFGKYQLERHSLGEMGKMGFKEYRSMIEESPIQTSIIEFRDLQETLLGCLLIDHTVNGTSAVYSFFDPDHSKRSIGKYMILWLIKFTMNVNKDYVYLGYWVEGSTNMAYKSMFKPLQYYIENNWVLKK